MAMAPSGVMPLKRPPAIGLGDAEMGAGWTGGATAAADTTRAAGANGITGSTAGAAGTSWTKEVEAGSTAGGDGGTGAGAAGTASEFASMGAATGLGSNTG